MIEAEAKPKLTSKQREMFSVAVEGFLLVLFMGVATVIWTNKHGVVTTKTVTVKAPAAVATATPNLGSVLGTTEKITIPNSVAPGYTLSMDVPKTWRVSNIRSLVPLSNYPDYNGDDLAAILRFVPENPERSKLYSSVEPVDMLDVLVTSKWASTRDDDVTAASKQAYLSYIGSLKTVADIAAKKCTPISFGGSLCTDKKVQPQIIKSADGSMSGLVYLSMQTQSVSYDPSVVVDMVGSVGGKPVRVNGVFRLYDKLYETVGSSGINANPNAKDWVSNVTAARNSFTDGNPPADTQAMYDRVVTAVKSMRFDKK